MKKFNWILCDVSLALVSAAMLSAQNTDASSPLREYVTPPAIRPVDTDFMEDMTWLEIRNAMQAGNTTVIVPAGGLEATGAFITLDEHQRLLRGSTDMIARKLGNALIATVIRYVPPDEPAGARGDYVGDFNI